MSLPASFILSFVPEIIATCFSSFLTGLTMTLATRSAPIAPMMTAIIVMESEVKITVFRAFATERIRFEVSTVMKIMPRI